MHTCWITFFFTHRGTKFERHPWKPIASVLSPTLVAPDRTFIKGDCGDGGTLPLQGTFCHLCCVRSPQIHYSGPSETPSSLPWNARAVHHLLQSSHPSGEWPLETKQAGNGREGRAGGGGRGARGGWTQNIQIHIISLRLIAYKDTQTQIQQWKSTAHLCISPTLNFYSWILSKPYHL